MRINASAKRSGNSLKISPDFVLNPPSIATIPSNKLHRSRTWIRTAPQTRKRAALRGALDPLNQRQPPAAAATMPLATEIWLGRNPRRARNRAPAAAQRVSRARIGRRVSCSVCIDLCRLRLLQNDSLSSEALAVEKQIPSTKQAHGALL